MKKFFLVLLALCAILMLTACGSEKMVPVETPDPFFKGIEIEPITVIPIEITEIVIEEIVLEETVLFEDVTTYW